MSRFRISALVALSLCSSLIGIEAAAASQLWTLHLRVENLAINRMIGLTPSQEAAHSMANVINQVAHSADVYVDGNDVGAYDLDKDLSYLIPANSRKLVLKVGGCGAGWSQMFFGLCKEVSNQLTIDGAARRRQVRVDCTMKATIFQPSIFCRTV